MRYGLACLAGIVCAQAHSAFDPYQPFDLAAQANQDPYWQAIQRTAKMVSDANANRLAESFSLNIVNVTWEDTGRYKNSSVGPNISDVTIQVPFKQGDKEVVTCMPVIRHPNFSDLTGDIDPQQFTLLVGNEKGKPLKRVSLWEYLDNPKQFMSNPSSWKGKNNTLLHVRDTKVLVSAQACFLPVPKAGKATFNPVIFNYQSYKDNPAVLVILATPEGTSMTVIDNTRDAFSSGSVWGQRLFHNKNGQRASLTGTRLSDYRPGSNNSGNSKNSSAGLNTVLLIQVPLKYKERERGFALPTVAFGSAAPSRKSSDVEVAVIGSGEAEGPFTEVGNLAIERDERFPIRVTVQQYLATSTGEINEQVVKTIKQSIDSIYAQATTVGSLVTSGETGRPTEYWGIKQQPADWWEKFWERYTKTTGVSKSDAQAKLAKLLGKNYRSKPVSDLYLRDLLK